MKFFTISDAARETGYGVDTLRRLSRSGAITVARDSRGARLFSEIDLERLRERRGRPSGFSQKRGR